MQIHRDHWDWKEIEKVELDIWKFELHKVHHKSEKSAEIVIVEGFLEVPIKFLFLVEPKVQNQDWHLFY